VRPIEDIIGDPAESGVYVLDAAVQAEQVETLARTRGFACFLLDGRSIRTKEDFLAHVATALRFPDYFGHNWDALADCLKDMAWVDATGYVVLFDAFDSFADAAPEQFATAVEIFKEAAESWKAQSKPFVALLRGPTGKAVQGTVVSVK
jgi:RNAse (barnase) inhibitor barstar